VHGGERKKKERSVSLKAKLMRSMSDFASYMGDRRHTQLIILPATAFYINVRIEELVTNIAYPYVT